VAGLGGFSTIGDALEPSNLGDALTLALDPTIFALFMTDFFDTIGTAMAVGTAGGLVDARGGCPGCAGCCSSTRPRRGRRRDGHVVGDDLRRVRRGRVGGRADRLRVARHRPGLFLLAVPFVPLMALAGQQVPYVDKTFISPAVAPALVPRRLPDDAPRRGRSTGATRCTRCPRSSSSPASR
jgi:AGZA family xanthine/uracil permease-like MFS transporter